MRSPFSLLLLAAALVAVRVDDARAQRAVNLSASIGATAPIGTTGDFLKTGYHVQVAGELHRSASPTGVRIEGMFHEMDFERDVTDDKLRVAGAVLNLVYATTWREGPFLTGGVGMYKVYPKEDRPFSNVYPTAKTSAGINLGVGVRFALTGFSTFTEVRFHRAFDDEKTQFIPFSFGITF
jgi:hypothetical protein